jgi:hypothetical protein
VAVLLGEILDLIRQSPGACLRQLGALLWPERSWLALSTEPLPLPTGTTTGALWLRDALRRMLGQGRVQLAPFRADQPGIAGLAYLIASG